VDHPLSWLFVLFVLFASVGGCRQGKLTFYKTESPSSVCGTSALRLLAFRYAVEENDNLQHSVLDYMPDCTS
jgi:hypothetical protein